MKPNFLPWTCFFGSQSRWRNVFFAVRSARRTTSRPRCLCKQATAQPATGYANFLCKWRRSHPFFSCRSVFWYRLLRGDLVCKSSRWSCFAIFYYRFDRLFFIRKEPVYANRYANSSHLASLFLGRLGYTVLGSKFLCKQGWFHYFQVFSCLQHANIRMKICVHLLFVCSGRWVSLCTKCWLATLRFAVRTRRKRIARFVHFLSIKSYDKFFRKFERPICLKGIAHTCGLDAWVQTRTYSN